MVNIEYLIIFLPLFASFISGFFGKYIGNKSSEILTSLFVSISAILSIIIFFTFQAHSDEKIDIWKNQNLKKNNNLERDDQDFDFNQDIDNDNENFRSPGWIRYQKRLK